MKLEELKYLWQEDAAAAPGQRLDESQIEAIMDSRSRTAIDKINRNILLEMLFVALIGVYWVYMLITAGTALPGEISAVFLYVIGSGIFYAFKFRSLNQASLRSGDLRTALSGWVRILSRFMAFYRWMGILLIPIAITGGISYGFYRSLLENGGSLSEVSLSTWGLLIGTIGLLNLLGFWLIPRFVRWYLRLVYGKHLDELKACLSELEEA